MASVIPNKSLLHYSNARSGFTNYRESKYHSGFQSENPIKWRNIWLEGGKARIGQVCCLKNKSVGNVIVCNINNNNDDDSKKRQQQKKKFRGCGVVNCTAGGGLLQVGGRSQQGDELMVAERFKVVALVALIMCLCNADRVVMSVAIVPLAAKNGWSSTFLGIVQVQLLPTYLPTTLLSPNQPLFLFLITIILPKQIRISYYYYFLNISFVNFC